MGTDGSLPQLGRNMGGLVDYVEVLITGKGASATGKPLGNKYFMRTGTKCTDVNTKKSVPRYIYINNVPSGGIPIISNVMGIKIDSFRGLVPGAIGNMSAVNPMALMSALSSGAKPKCEAITRETIDINNRVGTETQFVTIEDAKESFSGLAAAGGYTGIGIGTRNMSTKMPSDPMTQVYFACLSALVIYLIYRFMLLTSSVRVKR